MDAKDLVDVLVEQNKTYKEMMQFAITSIITLLVIFLTANFFVMRKMRKDEIERIQAEVKADIILGIKEQSLPELKKEMNEQLTLLIDNRFEFVDNKFELIDVQIKELIEGFRQSSDATSTTLSSFNQSIRRQSTSISDATNELRGEFHKLEGDIALYGEVYNNAFDSYLNAGRYFVDLKYSTGRINTILGCLEKSAESMEYVQNELSSFVYFSKKLEDVHQHQCDKIIGILKSKPTL